MNKESLQIKLESYLVDSGILLGTCKLLDSASKSAPAFMDRKYFPFYYYLGCLTSPTRVFQFGSKLGLIGACFMQGCKTVEHWVAVDPPEPKPPHQIIQSNLSKYCKGEAHALDLGGTLLTTERDLDMGLVTEKYPKEKFVEHLEFLWEHLRPEGLLVADYIDDDAVRDSFEGFCRVKNRKPDVYKTRYGVGILTR